MKIGILRVWNRKATIEFSFRFRYRSKCNQGCTYGGCASGEVIRKFYHYPYGNQTREEALEYFFESVVLEDYDRLVVSLKGYEGSVRIVELPFNEIRKVRSVLPYELENEFADGSHERSFRFHSIQIELKIYTKSSIFKYWCVRFSRQ